VRCEAKAKAKATVIRGQSWGLVGCGKGAAVCRYECMYVVVVVD